MEMTAKPYDPLDYNNLARSVVNALLEMTPESLPLRKSFKGIGVYAIYYTGGFAPYKKISSDKFITPIYVGQATPTGSRKGAPVESAMAGNALFSRLNQHAKSIEAATNLRLEDFRCRYLIVVPVWVGLAEQFLISHYKPVWNIVIDGFGNHDPGKGRKDMRKPRWDVLHPGRNWAEKLPAEETPEKLVAEIQKALK
jgi:hypothetical protein